MMEFRKPVSILVGLGFPSGVRNVQRAYAMLVDWPHTQRGPAHVVALNACRAALAGTVDAETARAAFVEFARRSGILIGETSHVAAHRAPTDQKGVTEKPLSH